MAMATQASLFSAAAPKSAVAAPWKQSLASFPSLKPAKTHTPRPIRAMAEEAPAATEAAPAAPAGFTPPELDPNTPSPIFGGSTGGLLRKAQVEEFYVITWESPKEQVFEMPTGGAAIMRQGPNLLKLARKEQCLALGTRLRSKYKINYQFYRVCSICTPGEGQRRPDRSWRNFRSIGKNVSPIEVKFSGKQVYDL